MYKYIIVLFLCIQALYAAEVPETNQKPANSYSNQMLQAVRQPKNLAALSLGLLASWAVYTYVFSSEKEEKAQPQRLSPEKKRSFKINKKSMRASARLKFVGLAIDLQYNPNAVNNFNETQAKLVEFCKKRNVANGDDLLQIFVSLHQSIQASIDLVNDMREIVTEEDQANHPVVALAEKIYQDEERNPNTNEVDLSAFDSETQDLLTGYLTALLDARRNREVAFQIITEFDRKCSSGRAQKTPKKRVHSKTFKTESTALNDDEG